MANVAVRNWRFLYKMGISGCHWFEGLGNYMQVRKLALCGADSPTIGPDSPTVLTVKILFTYPGKSTEEQGHLGRGELMSVPFASTNASFASNSPTCSRAAGFDASRDIAGIILNRWGTRTSAPRPGFSLERRQARARRSAARAPFGRIAFANTDLSGVADHRSRLSRLIAPSGSCWIRS